MLYAFLLDADPSGCALEEQARRRLDLKLGASPEQHADITLEIVRAIWRRRWTRAGCAKLYADIELPLARVLARMERTGIRIDPRGTEAPLGADGSGDRAAHGGDPRAGRQAVQHQLAATTGPRAVRRSGAARAGEIRQGQDHLHRRRRAGRAGRRSRDRAQGARIPAAHQAQGHLRGRAAGADGRATGRLHTSFNQTGAATGRLSSSNPNLQNIPIRTELGREIRAAFVPREGWKLLVADYSQIELRLLAHMSRRPAAGGGVPQRRGHPHAHRRRSAGRAADDGDAGSAAQRQGGELRHRIRHQRVRPGGAVGDLARARREKYIENYFARYAGVRRFIDATIAEVRQTGVTRTLFGRERPIPDINSRNPNARGFAERTAVNSPLQGTAADLIKLAMVRIDAALEAGGLPSAMLLQVHDELVFEAPPEEVGGVAALVKREMERRLRLDVPLLVDIGMGDNWRDAK